MIGGWSDLLTFLPWDKTQQTWHAIAKCLQGASLGMTKKLNGANSGRPTSHTGSKMRTANPSFKYIQQDEKMLWKYQEAWVWSEQNRCDNCRNLITPAHRMLMFNSESCDPIAASPLHRDQEQGEKEWEQEEEEEGQMASGRSNCGEEAGFRHKERKLEEWGRGGWLVRGERGRHQDGGESAEEILVGEERGADQQESKDANCLDWETADWVFHIHSDLVPSHSLSEFQLVLQPDVTLPHWRPVGGAHTHR